MRVDRRFVLEQSRLVGTVRDGHDINVPKFWTAFTPVTMCEDMMPSHFTAHFNLAAGRHRPMKQRVKPCHSHAASTWFNVFEEGGKPADDFPADVPGQGFDTTAGTLTVSPVLVEKYLAAAENVARTALFGVERMESERQGT